MLRRSLIPVLIAIFVAALVSAASRAEPLSNLSIDNVTVTEGTEPEATFTVTSRRAERRGRHLRLRDG